MSENRYVEIEEDEIDLKEIFRVILKYKYTIILTALLSLLIAGVYVYFKPNIYKATATVEVSSKNKSAIGGDIFSLSSSDNS